MSEPKRPETWLDVWEATLAEYFPDRNIHHLAAAAPVLLHALIRCTGATRTEEDLELGRIIIDTVTDPQILDNCWRNREE